MEDRERHAVAAATSSLLDVWSVGIRVPREVNGSMVGRCGGSGRVVKLASASDRGDKIYRCKDRLTLGNGGNGRECECV